MHHLIPQAPCLVTATGDWAADYVVRTENLAEDMKEVSGHSGQVAGRSGRCGACSPFLKHGLCSVPSIVLCLAMASIKGVSLPGLLVCRCGRR